jgi:riboflavin transporter FmnP
MILYPKVVIPVLIAVLVVGGEKGIYIKLAKETKTMFSTALSAV